MQESSSSRGPGVAIACALLVVLAVAGGAAALQLASGRFSEALGGALGLLRAGDLAGALGAGATDGGLGWLAIPTLGPLAVALVLFVAARPDRTAKGGVVPRTEPVAAPAAAPARPAPPSPAVGLRLLAVLQEEARLVDFVREDISAYSDEQVGSAVRGIHAALRKAIDERLTLEPILAGEDGDAVEVPEGFVPAQVRLTGHPSAGPPYRGILRHGGWRARNVRLPVPTEGSDPAILAPAEVEVG